MTSVEASEVIVMPDAGGRRSGPSVGLALSLGQLIGRAGLPRSRRREAALLGARRRSGGETGEAGGEEAGSPRLKCAASPRLALLRRTVSGPAVGGGKSIRRRAFPPPRGPWPCPFHSLNRRHFTPRL